MLKQNPFSLYDFLGYLIPGALLLFVAHSILKMPASIGLCTPFLLREVAQSSTWLLTPAMAAITAVVSYTLGHLASYVSSRSVELFSLWTLNYPSQYLFVPVRRHFIARGSTLSEQIGKFLTGVFLGPLCLFEIIASWLGFRQFLQKRLDPFLAETIRSRVQAFVEERVALDEIPDKKPNEERDHFRLVYHFVLEKSQVHPPRMQNYVAIYGFARTNTFIFAFFAWITLLKTSMSIELKTLLFVCFSGLSCLSYCNFVKFYRRFTLEAYMALISIMKPSEGKEYFEIREPRRESPRTLLRWRIRAGSSMLVVASIVAYAVLLSLGQITIFGSIFLASVLVGGFEIFFLSSSISFALQSFRSRLGTRKLSSS